MKQHSDYITVQTRASLTPVVREVTSALSDSGFGTDWHPQTCHHLTIRMMMDFPPARPPTLVRTQPDTPTRTQHSQKWGLTAQPTYLPPAPFFTHSFLLSALCSGFSLEIQAPPLPLSLWASTFPAVGPGPRARAHRLCSPPDEKTTAPQRREPAAGAALMKGRG